MGSEKDDPVLLGSNATMLLEWRQTLSKVLIASTLSVALTQLGGAAVAQSGDSKKSGLEPVAASSSPSKSAMSDPGAQKAIPPKSDITKTSSGSTTTSSNAPGGKAPASTAATGATADKVDKLPFPNINSDGLSTLSGLHVNFSRMFPSAIDIHGSSAGVLLHARKETKYDLLTPLSIWLEEGPLLVSVRHPSELVLVATKFGDICVTAGGDALVDRAEETLRIVNLSANDTVFLNMHDKLWTNSPWGHISKVQQLNEKQKTSKGKKGRSRTYEDIESGAIAIEPGYELVIGSEPLQMDEVKRQDGIGRRDFKTLTNGIFVLDEISVDNLAQAHDLIKNLKDHGQKASNVLGDITKSAGSLKSKQGEQGFEKVFPPPPKPTKKPPTPPRTPPPASTFGKPKKDTKDSTNKDSSSKESKDSGSSKSNSKSSTPPTSAPPAFPSTLPGSGSAPPAAPSTPINPTGK